VGTHSKRDGGRLIAVTGGGTSGHVVPAISIFEALMDVGYQPSELQYFGTERGIETRLIPPTGIAAEFLPVSGLQRSLSLDGIIRNIKMVPRLVVSLKRSLTWVKKNKPQAVVAVGGYASVPLSLAAVIHGVPLVVVCYEAIPGLATRILSRRAVATAVSSSDISLPHAVRAGAPVRRELRVIDRQARSKDARHRLGVSEDKFFVVAVGGSLGSKAINDAFVAAAEILDSGEATSGEFVFRHVVGDRFLESHKTPELGTCQYTAVGYEDQMVDVLCAADVLITRAGASTLAEVVTVGVPAIVIPWPQAAENHQLQNARILAAENAIVLVEEENLTGRGLAVEIDALRRDAQRGTQLARNAREVGAQNRSDSLARLIATVAESGSVTSDADA
jgi:UDP-N-acetylglucosamine--N-acetylmuramyl-(pentapeptide) pyrophosphoryl-undecaprenol N-acetylglucosamine transferase